MASASAGCDLIPSIKAGGAMGLRFNISTRAEIDER